ncbi:hypothetical protein Z968_04360 [Clostridium novyi A str. 4552]|uniref:Serine aminopeptidase S33 domain-containing protein n=1 Tax=Clostridium novyi A str. 4552 TaxID=1444289 RepID=A0A0A0ICG8_CLONO|nr:alpha/beta hydrolase [Clostridium novyi]KGM97235.1 hypothetical protein Z968_04360 [Clostridium novyi A str. 4552]
METLKKDVSLKRKKRTIIKNTLIFLIIVFLVTTGISIYVGLKLTSPKREKIKYNPKHYGLNYEDVSFKSKNQDVLLKGWWMPSQLKNKEIKSEKTIIFSHGYGNNRGLYKISVLNLAKKLCESGYNVLVFDFRASGESEGKFVTIGGLEKYDLLGAIDFVKNKKKSKIINLMGWSMGATTSILAGTESKDVKCIVADSPFGNLKEYLESNLSYWSKLPNTYFTKTILYILPKIRGFNIDKVNAIKAASSINNKKIFLIHSKDDDAIPYENTEKIYNSINNKSDVKVWITNNAKHIKSYSLYKDEYEKRVVEFFMNTK